MWEQGISLHFYRRDSWGSIFSKELEFEPLTFWFQAHVLSTTLGQADYRQFPPAFGNSYRPPQSHLTAPGDGSVVGLGRHWPMAAFSGTDSTNGDEGEEQWGGLSCNLGGRNCYSKVSNPERLQLGNPSKDTTLKLVNTYTHLGISHFTQCNLVCRNKQKWVDSPTVKRYPDAWDQKTCLRSLSLCNK